MYEGVVQDLIDELGRLPGVGPKSAQRIAFHLLQSDPVDVRRLAARAHRGQARRSGSARPAATSPQDEQCRICRDPRRDAHMLCVVEEPKDVVAIEKTREFRGRYHVLGGAISPIEGIGPDDLRVRELVTRLAVRRGHRDHPGHGPEPRGRGDGDLPRAAAQADGPDASPGWPPGCRSAGIWSTPTSSRSVALSRGGGCSMSDSRTHAPTTAPRSWTLRRIGEDTAAEAQAFLDALTEVAAGSSPDIAIPVLLLAVSQSLLAGARLGAISDIVPSERFEPDAGPEPDVDPLRAGLANLFDGLDEYADVVDPLTNGEVVRRLAVRRPRGRRGRPRPRPAPLPGRPRRRGPVVVAVLLPVDLGRRAPTAALRVLQSMLGHLRLDVRGRDRGGRRVRRAARCRDEPLRRPGRTSCAADVRRAPAQPPVRLGGRCRRHTRSLPWA